MNSSEVLIIPMESGHIEGIMAFESLCFAIPWTKKMFKEELTNEKAIYFVAVSDEVVVGYIGMWKVLDEGHITNVAVHPHYRRIKIGDALIKRLVNWSSQNEVIALTLEVRVSNIPAINLYAENNFQKSGIRKKYYADNNEDALIMWKKI